jgi:nucleotidyltransferase/DNA polymerase involved in DNA repair
MRSIVHWDADHFFAAVEQAADQRLRNRPVAVGGAGRGVVLSVSREAQRYGLRPGMTTTRARHLCSGLAVVPAHFELYEQFSRNILGLCEERTPLVEPVSVGAAYLDLTGTRAVNRAGPEELVRELRRTVGGWLRVSLSAGIAANKTVARIAARVRKPAAQVTVEGGHEAEFLAPLPVRWLPGVGYTTASTLELAGIRRIGELAHAPLDELSLVVGEDALSLARRAQGVDEEPVRRRGSSEPEWKETTQFPGEEWERERVVAALRSLLEQLMARLRAGGWQARRLTLRLRYTDHDEAERSVTLKEPSAVETAFFPHIEALLDGAWKRRVRLRGVEWRAARLYRPVGQLELFDAPGGADMGVGGQAAERLAAALDRIRGAFGERAVWRGAFGPLVAAQARGGSGSSGAAT